MLLGRLITGYAYTIGIVPFVLCAALFGRLAAKHRAGRWWLAAAIAQVAFVGWTVVSSVTLSDVPGKSTFTLGLRFPPWGEMSSWAALFSPTGGPSLLQLVLPLAAGLIYARTGIRQARA